MCTDVGACKLVLPCGVRGERREQEEEDCRPFARSQQLTLWGRRDHGGECGVAGSPVLGGPCLHPRELRRGGRGSHLPRPEAGNGARKNRPTRSVCMSVTQTRTCLIPKPRPSPRACGLPNPDKRPFCVSFSRNRKLPASGETTLRAKLGAPGLDMPPTLAIVLFSKTMEFTVFGQFVIVSRTLSPRPPDSDHLCYLPGHSRPFSEIGLGQSHFPA